jgi:preprotein translocase SecE subunit
MFISKVLDFIYDSIETLKQVKVPTKREVINMTIAVVVIVAITGAYLGLLDWFFMNLYKIFYSLFR